MNKLPKIVVPHGIKYISEWTDYKLPLGHIIVDKGVTGCGYTEFCLTNDNPVILCSPRKLLLENKNDQHQKRGDWNILYLENKNDKRDPSKFNKEEQENGFPISLKASANTFNVTVFPVPVAPAISPWRLAMAGSR